MTQFQLIADFAKASGIDLSMRVHPGAAGGGESATRDTGSEYSCFGGGLKVARMPEESQADIASLGAYAKQRIEEFKAETGRELQMEIEPGTFVVDNSGHIITRIIDKKLTNELNFLIVDGGMELLTRPLLIRKKQVRAQLVENELDVKL